MAETASRLANLSPEKRKLLEQLLREKKAPPKAEAPAEEPAALTFAPGATAEETKIQFRQFYDEISRRLAASGFGDLSFFLNFGYVANGSEEYAAVAPPLHIPNRNS